MIVMRVIQILAIGVLVVSGCATVRETSAPDGRKAYTLNCSGLTRGWDKCQKAAGDICGSAGYDILYQSTEDTASSGEGENSKGGVGVAHIIKSNKRSMLIACKK